MLLCRTILLRVFAVVFFVSLISSASAAQVRRKPELPISKSAIDRMFVKVKGEKLIGEDEPLKDHTNYLSQMMDCCLHADHQQGKAVEALRNAKIDALNLDEVKISYEDLNLLAKIITAEAGCSWLPDEWKMMVGEVLLNRVESPEFPSTVAQCVYQEGQYHGSNNPYFEGLLPFEDCLEAAVRLLQGERVINDPAVVFQAQFRQGSGVYRKLSDQIMGATYLCYSNHPELYAAH